MFHVSIEGIGDPETFTYTDYGLTPLVPKLEEFHYDEGFHMSPRSLDLEFDLEYYSDEKMHRAVSWYNRSFFSDYKEVIVRFRKIDNE